MTSIDDLRMLIDWLEKRAQGNERVRLSDRCNGLLHAVYEAQKVASLKSNARADEVLFRIIISPSKHAGDDIAAHTCDIAIAKAMFDAALKLYPDRKISLYEGSRVVQETT